MRCRASVSSTTPRFGPRWPPVRETLRTRKSLISAASSVSSSSLRLRRSRGPVTRSSSAICPPCVDTFDADQSRAVDHHRGRGGAGTVKCDRSGEALLRAALVREGAAGTLDAEGSVDDVLL